MSVAIQAVRIVVSPMSSVRRTIGREPLTLPELGVQLRLLESRRTKSNGSRMKLPAQLLPDPLPDDPMPLAEAWLAEAWERRVQPNPDAMVLATCTAGGGPSARVVLCKRIVASPGYLLFYTNYRSRKGRELANNARAAGVLHWDTLHRQLRIEGRVVKATAAESDAYFATRAWQSRVGAWASRQSEPIASRAALVSAVRSAATRLGTPDPTTEDVPPDAAVPVPRPAHWGGYRLWLESIEFWVEGEFRIHDRARWQRSLTAVDEHTYAAGPWSASRLQP
jgi:pyridoxamine 5'-phosphate oxidase